jgi:hypothetical protein
MPDRAPGAVAPRQNRSHVFLLQKSGINTAMSEKIAAVKGQDLSCGWQAYGYEETVRNHYPGIAQARYSMQVSDGTVFTQFSGGKFPRNFWLWRNPEMRFVRTLLGPFAPRHFGIPRYDSAVLPVLGADLSAGTTKASFTPPPPWGQGWHKGGCISKNKKRFSTSPIFALFQNRDRNN